RLVFLELGSFQDAAAEADFQEAGDSPAKEGAAVEGEAALADRGVRGGPDRISRQVEGEHRRAVLRVPVEAGLGGELPAQRTCAAAAPVEGEAAVEEVLRAEI